MSPGCFQPLLISGFDIHLMSRARAAAGAQAGQPPAVLPELQQLMGSVLGGHHPPTGIHRKDRASCGARSNDKQLTHHQRCRWFFRNSLQKSGLTISAPALLGSTPCAEQGRAGGHRTGTPRVGSACTPREVRSMKMSYLPSLVLIAPGAEHLHVW